MCPKDTNISNSADGKVCLTEQTPIVRAMITKVFKFLNATIVLKDTFPDSVLMGRFIEDALSTAALHVPNAEDIHVRILQDRGYCFQMLALVSMYAIPRSLGNESM